LERRAKEHGISLRCSSLLSGLAYWTDSKSLSAQVQCIGWNPARKERTTERAKEQTNERPFIRRARAEMAVL